MLLKFVPGFYTVELLKSNVKLAMPVKLLHDVVQPLVPCMRLSWIKQNYKKWLVDCTFNMFLRGICSCHTISYFKRVFISRVTISHMGQGAQYDVMVISNTHRKFVLALDGNLSAAEKI
jgi:hypothetical protein